MPTYSTSEATKTALIMAAGELFAEYGVEAVTTREIARKAGENTGIIHYHFGGKEGLVNAVMDFVNEPWCRDPLGAFLKEHRQDLKSPEGQKMVISHLIKIFFSIHFSTGRPSWCCTMAFRILQKDLDISLKTFDIAVRSFVNVFLEIYRTVTGDEDFERGYIWCSSIVAPSVLFLLIPMNLKRMHPDGGPRDEFIPKLEDFCIQNAISTLNRLKKTSKPNQSKRSNKS